MFDKTYIILFRLSYSKQKLIFQLNWFRYIFRAMRRSGILLLLLSIIFWASEATKYKMIESNEEFGLECALCRKILKEKYLTDWNLQGHVVY